MMTRIVVTGVGCVSSAGTGVDAYWNALAEAAHQPSQPTRFDIERSQRIHEVVEVGGVPPIKRKAAAERGMQMALACTCLALEHGKLDPGSMEAERTGVVYGSTLEAVRALSEFHRRVLKEGPRCADPGLFPNTGMSAAACQVSIALGFRAFNTTDRKSVV